jgi:hypothetical protein
MMLVKTLTKCWNRKYTRTIHKTLFCDFKLQQQSSWELRSSGLLCSCIITQKSVGLIKHYYSDLKCNGTGPHIVYIYTGCNRRNGPYFGRVFLRSNYTKKPQNTYTQSSMVTEILAREKCGLLWCLRTVLYLWRHTQLIWGMGPIYYNCIPTLSLEAAERPWLS